jgi:pyruvate-formate lyase-activating enzyme
MVEGSCRAREVGRWPRGMMDPAEIAAARPEPLARHSLDRARARMMETGQWHPLQSMGRRWNMGCVALEITQRCNLDCTLCYLSDHSEAVKDIPLTEVFRRIDAIRAQYGPGTEVQVTGGDPTLRERSELVRIIRHIRAQGMQPNLFTNGIRASRALLAELAAAGLADVAFHVDTTQQRKGYTDEASLNPLRELYIARARGLGLRILFNTTVHDGNLADIPDVAAFFTRHADTVSLASFQLQAETGRGVAGGSAGAVSMPRVIAQLQRGLGARLSFDTPMAGHLECNRHALALVADGAVLDLYDDKRVLAGLLDMTSDLKFERMRPWQGAVRFLGRLPRHPRFAALLLPWAARKAWGFRGALWRARGRAHRLAFFIHDFMDAGQLCRERIGACIFMVQTAEGPISMCLHNAKRDAFILQPLALPGAGWWDPLTGEARTAPRAKATPVLSPKTARGRRRIEIHHQVRT